MIKINIDLIETKTLNTAGNNYNLKDFGETTEAENLARDILAPLAVDALFIDSGDYHQASAAACGRLGRLFLDCSAAVGAALWFCGDSEEAEQLTTADGFRVRAFGWHKFAAVPVLILENPETEEDRAYLVRFDW